ncbi:unnamed protein product [Strongylus vulgaris]|uniref:Uncharacterized protein n=1 Tax=Strongylus vulgaris TaxID=40348 RepID=A0A3P7IQZ9_STRVU|nr:unnamed protein product [Strongylus vulgaris]
MVGQYYHIVHGFIVDTFLKTVRFLEAKRKAIEQWWEKDGRTQFGGVVDTVKVTAGVIYEIAKDVFQLTIGGTFLVIQIALWLFISQAFGKRA